MRFINAAHLFAESTLNSGSGNVNCYDFHYPVIRCDRCVKAHHHLFDVFLGVKMLTCDIIVGGWIVLVGNM